MPNFGITSEGPRMFFLEGEVDLATVPVVNTAVGEAISRGGPITIDISGVSFMDSTGIGALLQAAKNLPSGCIVLHGVHDGVGKVMNLMGVDRAMPELHVIPCALGPQ
jgi:anti-sigma B factor antagonist